MKFTEEKLQELLHYTDLDENPFYEVVKSNCYYKIYAGAKGVSKSFGRMIETIYRIVNQKEFNSIWCRNQYNHIKTTLKPLVIKVLDFLAANGLDYKNYFTITNEAAYYNFDDGGKGRAIYFQNWEKIQAFQGFTLPDLNFRFGELVIDEPLEDVSQSNKSFDEIQEIYKIQQEKLPLLEDNTVRRQGSLPEGFNVNVTFLFNIFTLDHFLIRDYLAHTLPIFIKSKKQSGDNVLNVGLRDSLVENKYLLNENSEFAGGLGLAAIMFSKLYIPKRELSEIQIKGFELLKQNNPRLWAVTVAGFGFNTTNEALNYFMKDILFTETDKKRKNIKLIKLNKLKEIIQQDEIATGYFGFDLGISDNSALVGVLMKKDGQLIVFECIKDIKTLIGKTQYKNKEIINKVVSIIAKWVKTFMEWAPYYSELAQGGFGVCCDNNASIEALNYEFLKLNLNELIFAKPAKRLPKQGFGIEDRQQWMKNIFNYGLVELLPNCELLLWSLSKQAIDKRKNETKRDETINKEIYDLINAFEMACSYLFRSQYIYLSNQNYKII